MAQFVSIEAWRVNGRGWTPQQNREYSSLVRALSSYCRAVVKYAAYNLTLLEKAQEVLDDAAETAKAEMHLRTVVEESQDSTHAVDVPATPEDFVRTVVRIMKTKTKRLKQHSRRAARVQNTGAKVQQKVAEWPKELISEAGDFKNWSQDIFMHIAIVVMSKYFEAEGIEVQIADGIQDSYRRHDLKDQIKSHGSVLGVVDYAIPESRESAMAARAKDSWDEFYDNLDFWLQKDKAGNYLRVSTL